MAHCAEIDNQGVVKRVIVVEDYYGDLTCEQWCEKRFGGTWKKTSYNTGGGKHKLGGVPLRMNFASIGYKYDTEKDAFIPPQPYPSWQLDEKTCHWKAPKERPKGEGLDWDEELKDWKK